MKDSDFCPRMVKNYYYCYYFASICLPIFSSLYVILLCQHG